ncbi:hypothetical protein EVAR_92961_1 [Eumeta japonica]|uniref:Uncharacterized protein n=1 Tax=Eumeta variegata TaxID=151549 RepID=A0A4C1TBB3_EUMVA|nr:hypothetical protein EVAR_92961_1 [Eumeta japonica]
MKAIFAYAFRIDPGFIRNPNDGPTSNSTLPRTSLLPIAVLRPRERSREQERSNVLDNFQSGLARRGAGTPAHVSGARDGAGYGRLPNRRNNTDAIAQRPRLAWQRDTRAGTLVLRRVVLARRPVRA